MAAPVVVVVDLLAVVVAADRSFPAGIAHNPCAPVP